MDENRERLIEVLLEEELGGDAPPDLAERIVTRAFGSRLRSRFRTALMLAAASIVLAVGVWWALQPGYPEPRASGDYELVQGDAVAREAVLRSRQQPATVELGGYCRVELQPHTTVRIQGEPRAEAVFLESGEVLCNVDRGSGTFSVRTPAGTVSVRGTQFTVQVVDEKRGEAMEKRVFVRVLVGVVLLSGAWGTMELFAGEAAAADEKKADKRKGTVVGVVTTKGDNFIEVKADGEEKARRYVPHWVGGAPAAGGGPDKAMVAQIAKVPVGARVRIEWEFEERARVVKLEVLAAPKK